MSRAKERVLAEARRLVEADGTVPSMSALARACGISRQALYLHYPDRAALLVALVVAVDEREDLQRGVAAIDAASDGPAKVRAWVEMQAWRNPRIALLARALDGARRTEAAADAAWRDRAANRMRGATDIAAVLRAEGRIDGTWSAEEAAVLLWELVSFRVWDDLVNDAGLAPARYVDIVVATALAALRAPVGGPPRETVTPPR